MYTYSDAKDECSRCVVYIACKYRHHRIVERMKNLADKSERSPSSVILEACHEYLLRYEEEAC